MEQSQYLSKKKNSILSRLKKSLSLSCLSVSETQEVDVAPEDEEEEEAIEQQQPQEREQHVIVMRHGDRIDQVIDRRQPLWVSTAKNKWDPPLHEEGKVRAFSKGTDLKKTQVQIHRVFVSPFIRCVQTALQVVSALCANNQDHNNPKVSIEYGLCEMINEQAIKPALAPKKYKFSFDMSKIEAMFPANTVDQTVEPVDQNLPKWEESVLDARARFKRVIETLSDRYPSENLLLITHGEGVKVAVSDFLENKNTTVDGVEYCAYSHLKRHISFSSSQMSMAEKFEVIGQSGVKFGSSSDRRLDV